MRFHSTLGSRTGKASVTSQTRTHSEAQPQEQREATPSYTHVPLQQLTTRGQVAAPAVLEHRTSSGAREGWVDKESVSYSNLCGGFAWPEPRRATRVAGELQPRKVGTPYHNRAKTAKGNNKFQEA
eukprot:4095418-Amphidinium_carterae.1